MDVAAVTTESGDGSPPEITTNRIPLQAIVAGNDTCWCRDFGHLVDPTPVRPVGHCDERSGG